MTGAPTRLRVEHLLNPLGLGVPRPRFTWWLPEGAERQLAYRVRADTGWDTGWVLGDESVLVAYDGPPLTSARAVDWQVSVRTNLGESPWSPSSRFELGLLAASDWSARWIEPYEREVAAPGERPVWRLRRVFEIEDTVASARLYATAHGLYEAFLNGRRVGDAELTPGYTEYRSRLQVQTYDVSTMLRPGRNVLEVLLSDGWFRGQVGLARAHDQWGTALGLLAELRADGRPVCVTDDSWTSRPSEVTRADLIGGQTTDLRRDRRAGDVERERDDEGDPVGLPDLGLERLVASPAPPIRRVQELRPMSVTRNGRGQVFDLGQNINGWVRLRDMGPEGTALTLVHGEALDAVGDLTTAHLDVDLPFLSEPLPAGQVDRVISAGRPGDVFEPRHTTHGFRYVRVEGHPGELADDALTGVVVHTDLERTGWFQCSDERINRLHEAAVWSLRGNLCGVPTDCPTRERASWTGDWQLFVPTAAFLYDVAGFCTKWLRDLAAEQTPQGLVANLAPSPPHESPTGPLGAMNGSAGWGDAAVIVPWEMYRAYGDARLLAEQWPSMTAWLGYVERAAAERRHPDRIARAAQPRPHEHRLWDTGFHFGEWLEPGADLKGPEEFAAFQAADKADVATAYFAHSAWLMSQIAEVLHRDAHADRYRQLASEATAAWQAEFLGDDGSLRPDTQAAHVRALAFELVPTEVRAAVVARLVQLIRAADDHLATGFLTTPHLLPVLADSGHLDLAYTLLLQRSMPSWLYMIDRGATTMWERWDGIREDGTPYESLNHYSKGAVISFLHRHVAGIQLLDGHPAYRHFRIAPQPGGGIAWARARHASPYGIIESAWRVADDGLELAVTVPPGTSAEALLPDGTRTVLASGRHELTGAVAPGLSST